MTKRILLGATAPMEDRNSVLRALLFFDKLHVLVGTRKIPTLDTLFSLLPYQLVEENIVEITLLEDLDPDAKHEIGIIRESLAPLLIGGAIIETASGDALATKTLEHVIDDLSMDIFISSVLGIPIWSSQFFTSLIGSMQRQSSESDTLARGEFLSDSSPGILGMQLIQSFAGAEDLAALPMESVLKLRSHPSSDRFREWISELSHKLSLEKTEDSYHLIKTELEREQKNLELDASSFPVLLKRLTLALLPFLLGGLQPGIQAASLTAIAQIISTLISKSKNQLSPLFFPSLLSEAARENNAERI